MLMVSPPGLSRLFLYCSSIVPLLFLYCSSIVPLFLASFPRLTQPVPGGSQSIAPKHLQLVLPTVCLLPHPDEDARAFQGNVISPMRQLPPLLQLLQIEFGEVYLAFGWRREKPEEGIKAVLVHARVARRPGEHHQVLLRRAILPADIRGHLHLQGNLASELACDGFPPRR